MPINKYKVLFFTDIAIVRGFRDTMSVICGWEDINQHGVEHCVFPTVV